MSGFRIGVALCSYNGATYIKEQLDSIHGQTRLPDLLVVVDDRSGDNTVEIARAFAATAPFPVEVVVNEANLGYVKNFEKAIGLCEGDIIVLSDQDDVWYPEKLQVIEDTFTAHPDAGAVFSDADVVGESLQPFGYLLWQTIDFTRRKQRRVYEGRAFEQLLKRNVVTGATMAFKRDYLPDMAPFPTSWVHDGWIALLIACRARIVPIDRPLIRYRQHAKNQIGARQRSIAERIANSRKMKHAFYQADVQRAIDAAERIRQLYGEGDKRLAILKKKIAHGKARAALPEKRISRLLPILREMVFFHYARYSNGVKSAIRDVVV